MSVASDLERFATEFSRLIWLELGPEQCAEVDAANKLLTADPLYTHNPWVSLHGDCATHGLCDPNEIIQYAFEAVYGRELDASSPHDQTVINQAWDICWDKGFAVLGAPEQ